MSRSFRVAALAVLAALSVCVRANAGLEPARMFNPGSESLFAALNAPRAMSPIEIALFNVVPAAEGFAPRSSAPGVRPPSGAGVATVNFSIPQLRSSYVPELAVAAPKAQLRVPSSGESVPSTAGPKAQVVGLRPTPPLAPAIALEPVRFGS